MVVATFDWVGLFYIVSSLLLQANTLFMLASKEDGSFYLSWLVFELFFGNEIKK